MTTVELIALVYQLLGEDGAGFYTDTKVLRALNLAYRQLRHLVLRYDHDGLFLSTWADATYPANTMWQDFSGAGAEHWTTLGTPLKIYQCRIISALNARELGTPIAIVPVRQEYEYANRYNDTYLVEYAGKIGLRTNGVPPGSATLLRIKFAPPITALAGGGSPVNAEFIPDFYELIGMQAAVYLAVSEDKPINDLARAADNLQEQLIDHLSVARTNYERPEITVDWETEQFYDYGH